MDAPQPFTTPARSRRPATPLPALGALLLSVVVHAWALPSSAHQFVVRPDGGGDATTVRGGLDLVYARALDNNTPPPADTLLIMPGDYDESIDLDLARLPWGIHVVAPAGFVETRVRSLRVDPTLARHFCDDIDPEHGALVSGLAIGERVVQACEVTLTTWLHCRFESGYEAQGGGLYAQSYEGCEFHGRVVLHGFVGAGSIHPGIHDCHFVGATLDLADDPDGDVGLTRCSFEGPADTAVIAHPSRDNGMHFIDCRFSRMRYGIVESEASISTLGPMIERSTFEDIAEDAVRYSSDYQYSDASSYFEAPALHVAHSRFTRCGSAVVWRSTAAPLVELVADTITTTRETAILVEGACVLESLVVSRSGGDGASLLAHSGDLVNPLAVPMVILQSTFQDNVGSGLVVRDTMTADFVAGADRVTGCTFRGNAGAGLVCQGESLSVAHNVAHGNQGVGISVELRGAALGAILSENSSVLNRGDGLVLMAQGTSVPVVAKNLVAFNDGKGFELAANAAGAASHNDTWSNGNVGVALPSTENLALDPGFCDALAGDDRLQTRSPCGSSGPFGGIGALGVGCDASRISISVFAGQGGRRLPDRGHAPIPAAVLGTRVLDVSTLDPSTARLGAAPSTIGGPPAHRPSISDVNGDGRADLEMWFDASDVGPVGASGTLILDISTTAGLSESGEAATRRATLAADTQSGDSDHAMSTDVKTPSLKIVSTSFNRTTQRPHVAFTLPSSGSVSLEVFDISGRRVARSEPIAGRTGLQSADVNTEQPVRAGFYVVRLTTGSARASAPLVVIR